MDFEKESSSMDMKEEMMNDAVDDVMDDEENEEEEGERILTEVFDELGISVKQQVSASSLPLVSCSLRGQMGEAPTALGATEPLSEQRQKVAIGESAGNGPTTSTNDPPAADLGGGMDDMQRRLDELRK